MLTSVRLRLLMMALLPLILLMPLLLLLGLSRWTSDYDELLISKVESDLKIAEQYLAQIMTATGSDLAGIAGAAGFADALARDQSERQDYLNQRRDEHGFDFLYFLPEEALESGPKWPVVAAAMTGQSATAIDIFSPQDLETVAESLKDTARIPLVATEAAVPTDRTAEDRGMVVHSASPVSLSGKTGVVVGGILLNRNLQFIDTINSLVYLNAVTGGERQGTATLFLEDVRISTNVRLFEDVRALGTRVSAEVREAVLGQGETWLNRAFVVNDWYVSGYLPIRDSFENNVGMLYVGFLEAPFSATKRAAILWMLTAFVLVLLISTPVFLWLAKGIFSPLEAMSKTMKRVERGDLSARNGDLGAKGEIGQVAAHLDSLLEQVQDRDQELRGWADQLNFRVDKRTKELSDANQKLEAATQQLVMAEKLASIGEITAGVAHEINNPVAVIQGNVDVMRESLGAASKDVEIEFNLIDRQIARISAIVGKLLQFARPADYSDTTSSVVLQTVLDDCLVLVDHVLSEKKITIIKVYSETATVRIDPGELQQVIVNLVMNAAQAMGDEGTLTLTLATAERDAQVGSSLSVTDTGPGIDPEKLANVFDPFFTTKQAEGTGLGLSISQTIIRRAGGLITAQNQPKGGARFEIWLPAATSISHAAQ
ncbi:MAG: cache domain-containing protein [Pseudomonadota bacterium]